MFSFYTLTVDPETQASEIKKHQYEDTPENAALKEKLQREIAKFEHVRVTYMDRYYHCDRYEETSPLTLSWSVFRDGEFVGYMVDDVFYVLPGSNIQVFEKKRGATSCQVLEGVRRK